MNAQQFTVLSLYSGGLGLDLGLEMTGRFRLLACVEKVPAFCETIRRNRDAGRVATRDMAVYEADATDLDPVKMMRDLGLEVGEVDLIVGGPPCQSFSTTGKRGTVQDPRGSQLWQFLKFINTMRPKAFIMENVRGLMSAALQHRPIKERPDKGGPVYSEAELPGSVIRTFVRDLHNAYRTDCFEVNAVNYGAPQLRERAIFLGNCYNHVTDFPSPTHAMESCQADLFGTPSLMPYRTLSDALSGLSESDPLVMDFSPRKKAFLKLVPPGGNWRSLPEAVAKESMGKAYVAKGGRSGWWRRLTMELPCPTIVTMPNHASTSLCHPTETRALSLRECARVQEFPDEWEFWGRTPEQYTQVGNAVPVRLGRVAGEVAAALLDEIYATDFVRSPGPTLPCRVVYVQSHVRTRQWFKAGESVIWKGSGDARHAPAKTGRKVRNLE